MNIGRDTNTALLSTKTYLLMKECNLRWPAATDALLSDRIALPTATL